MASLSEKHGLGKATEVLIGGDSAGGLATFMVSAAARCRPLPLPLPLLPLLTAVLQHIDAFADHIHAAAPAAKVLGMPDSGFWPDDTAQGFSGTFDRMYKMQNNGSYYGMVRAAAADAGAGAAAGVDAGASATAGAAAGAGAATAAAAAAFFCRRRRR
jgi:hypothetical protein